jgi:dTDP-4-dehydrorhamnose reductase
MKLNSRKKILLTGASGRLGIALQKHIECICPDLDELDIRDFGQCLRVMKKYKPDIVIHAAAYTNVSSAEKNNKDCWDINVFGTENIARASDGRRLVYISTDYVFDGEKGDYSEEDTPNPVNYYALTKLAGEVIIRQYQNTLIIRTAFKPDGPWAYPKAFVDQWASHDFVSKIAPDIARAATMMSLIGVIHIAGEKKTIYDLAKQVSPDVGKIRIKDVDVRIPKDTSLNTSKWKKILSKSKKQKK